MPCTVSGTVFCKIVSRSFKKHSDIFGAKQDSKPKRAGAIHAAEATINKVKEIKRGDDVGMPSSVWHILGMEYVPH